MRERHADPYRDVNGSLVYEGATAHHPNGVRRQDFGAKLLSFTPQGKMMMVNRHHQAITMVNTPREYVKYVADHFDKLKQGASGY
jgi:hypothetical protein